MGQCRSPSVSPSRQASSSISPAEVSLFEQYLQGGNPFERQIDNKEEETEDVLASNGVGAPSTEKVLAENVTSSPFRLMVFQVKGCFMLMVNIAEPRVYV